MFIVSDVFTALPPRELSLYHLALLNGKMPNMKGRFFFKTRHYVGVLGFYLRLYYTLNNAGK